MSDSTPSKWHYAWLTIPVLLFFLVASSGIQTNKVNLRPPAAAVVGTSGGEVVSGAQSKAVAKAQLYAGNNMQDLGLEVHSSKVSAAWMFMFYHKSGHSLTWALVDGLTESAQRDNSSLVTSRKERIKRKFVSDEDLLANSKRFDYMVYIACDFNFGPLQLHVPQFRFIHVVRNPYDLVYSGFVYHQKGAAAEKWEHHPEFWELSNFCKPPATWRPDQQRSAKSIGVTDEMLQYVYNTCVELHGKATTKLVAKSAKKTYLNALNTLAKDDYLDGLFLEASRAIARWDSQSGGADIIRMGYMAKKSNQVPQTLRVFMKDFTSSTESFSRTLDCMAEFMQFDVQGLDVEKTREAMIKHADLNSGADPYNGRKDHVTSKSVDKQRKQIAIQQLKMHPGFGPILDIVQRLLEKPGQAHTCKTHKQFLP